MSGEYRVHNHNYEDWLVGECMGFCVSQEIGIRRDPTLIQEERSTYLSVTGFRSNTTLKGGKLLLAAHNWV